LFPEVNRVLAVRLLGLLAERVLASAAGPGGGGGGERDECAG